MKSLCLSQSLTLLHISTTCSQKQPRIPFPKKTQLGFKHHSSSNSISVTYGQFIQKSLPFAASLALLLSAAYPASAGILSGSTGIESVPGPELPQVDFLNRINEEKQKKYAENDARFKSSPILKKLLEQSKINKQKNQQEIQDKYCIRGAEWGIGDCSAEGMSPQDRENFIAKLKQKSWDIKNEDQFCSNLIN